VRREGGRWRITVFCSNVPAQVSTPVSEAVGIDVGFNELVATSTGELIGNARHLKRSLCRLADRQRLVAGRRRGSKRRRKASRQIGRLHRKVRSQRRDLAHQISRQLVNRYGLIAHEDLTISNMVRRPKPHPNDEGGFDPNGAAAKAGLNREILAAGWGQLLRFIGYKAEEAGCHVIAVSPRHTSQTCHACGHVDPESRHATEFRCTSCGHSDHADVNAARNILRAGLARRHEREADNRVA
jgi:putative transposase